MNPRSRSRMFFLATADGQGRPDCSYKGGLPGFVRIVDERTLAFPDNNGNGMYRSLSNVLVNQSVALLFIDFDRPQRLRVLGEATLHDTDLLLAELPGAQLLIRVRATRIFPNCPRYVHEMRSLIVLHYRNRLLGWSERQPSVRRFFRAVQLLTIGRQKELANGKPIEV
ncbi:MAG TPA: pyridoxamine 5'-phosphate oxidase family protein [Terriglobales bacterium]|nr:pyridoxamine 5'-phosphate oxidase family protein [Terriglobales bacterium]